MKFIIKRKNFLKPLQQVINLLVTRPKLPIIGNILLKIQEDNLLLITTDLEIEIIAKIKLLTIYSVGAITIPARKLFDICRNFPEDAEIIISTINNQVSICSERSRYLLATLPANNFPKIDHWQNQIKFILSQQKLKRLIELTKFSMAYQDTRYYLNGMLFEIQDQEIHAVTTDGHRLSFCAISINEFVTLHSVIISRKGVLELFKILNINDNLITIYIGDNNIRFIINDITFTTKVINGKFPDYKHILSTTTNKLVKIKCDVLKQALNRAAILSNNKFRGIRLSFSENQLKITASNSEDEEAEEIIDVIYYGVTIEISLNVNYILDVLNTIKCENIHLLLHNETSSIQIKSDNNQNLIYVIMPMRI